jgi:hypothetical protein
VIQLTGEPKAFDDKQMRIGDTNTIGWAYILGF